MGIDRSLFDREDDYSLTKAATACSFVTIDDEDDDEDEAPSFFPSPLLLPSLSPLVLAPVLAVLVSCERGWKASHVASTVTAPPTYHRNVNT